MGYSSSVMILSCDALLAPKQFYVINFSIITFDRLCQIEKRVNDRKC